MNTRGLLHPIGARVRLKIGGPDMLVVDLDPERATRVAAWKDGDAVAEATYAVDALQPAGIPA